MKLSPVMMVGGIDGSGKSEFARRLESACVDDGLSVCLMHVDDFRRPVDFQNPPVSELESYYTDYFDLSALDRALADRRAGSLHAVIVEGIFTARLAIAAEAFSIWLEVPRAEARRRIEARDVARGRSPEEVRHRIDTRYFPAQDRYQRDHAPANRAQILLDNTNFSALVVVRTTPTSTWPQVFRRPLSRLLGPTP
jgi:cytidylate kinase